jgi:hypothetical protein
MEHCPKHDKVFPEGEQCSGCVDEGSSTKVPASVPASVLLEIVPKKDGAVQEERVSSDDLLYAIEEAAHRGCEKAFHESREKRIEELLTFLDSAEVKQAANDFAQGLLSSLVPVNVTPVNAAADLPEEEK